MHLPEVAAPSTTRIPASPTGHLGDCIAIGTRAAVHAVALEAVPVELAEMRHREGGESQRHIGILEVDGGAASAVCRWPARRAVIHATPAVEGCAGVIGAARPGERQRPPLRKEAAC